MQTSNQLLQRIEQAGMWSYFHKDWLLQIREVVRSQLPAAYRVFVESETVLISPGTFAQAHAAYLPDILVTREPNETVSAATSNLPDGTTATIVDAEESCYLESHYRLVIRRATNHEVVAAAEVLSPSNKGIGNQLDQQKFLRKRSDYLDAGVNLLEIDALLEGKRELPPPLNDVQPYARIAWTALHDRGKRRYRGWGWQPSDTPPKILWPIESTQAVSIDLAQTLIDATSFNNWQSMSGN